MQRVIIKPYPTSLRDLWWFVRKGKPFFGLRCFLGIGWRGWAGKPSPFTLDNWGLHFDAGEADNERLD